MTRLLTPAILLVLTATAACGGGGGNTGGSGGTGGSMVTSSATSSSSGTTSSSSGTGGMMSTSSSSGTGGSVASCAGENYTAQRVGAFIVDTTTQGGFPPQPQPGIDGAALTAQPQCATAISLPPADSMGSWRTQGPNDQDLLPRNVPLWIRFEKTGYLPLNTVEIMFTGGLSGTYHDKYLGMVATSAQSVVFPHWGATKAAVIVEVDEMCDTDGLTVALDGHPEAKVIYWGAAAPDASLTAMNKDRPRATIDDITPGAPTTLTVTDTAGKGCMPSIIPSLASQFPTGKVPIVAGEVTHVILGAL